MDDKTPTDPMLVDAAGEDNDSGISSADSSRRESISSDASFATTFSGTSSSSSRFQSLSDRRSSTSSDASRTSSGSNFSLRSAASLLSSGYSNGYDSSHRSSLSSVQSDDSTTTIHSDVTMMSERSGHSAVGGPFRPPSGPMHPPRAPSEPMAQVLVAFNGKNYTINIKLTDTVKSLKNKIRDKIGLDFSQHSLQYQGKALTDDSATLQYYGIKNLSNVTLISRLRGGAMNM